MAKDANMNKLQQQVAKLWTQHEQIKYCVTELQEEAKKVTGIIQISHEKVRQDFGSMGMTTSEHISSKFVQ